MPFSLKKIFNRKKSKEENEEDEAITAMDLATADTAVGVNLKKEDNSLTNTVEFLSWIQEFSKKVVAVTFVVYLVAMAFSLIMIALQFRLTLEAEFLDTFITELNDTFRDVIGGYLLKAATENVIKIGGGYMESYMSSKTTIIEQKVAAVASAPIGDVDEGDHEEYVEKSAPGEEDPLANRNF